MTNDEMNKALFELENTHLWIAVLKYLRARAAIPHSVLLSTDPLKDASSISKAQGILVGLSDLQNMVITLKTPPKADDSEEEQES